MVQARFSKLGFPISNFGLHLRRKFGFQIIQKQGGLPFKDSRKNIYLMCSPYTLAVFKISPDSNNFQFRISDFRLMRTRSGWSNLGLEDFLIRNWKSEIGNQNSDLNPEI
jgi:hypothetical protein